ncbi:MAG: S-layer homology domain-containing protein [Oscillospiraceae bacterium]|nr:S-layer homology domain-containing protein [Oscillospiraceae bacterium]
MKRIFAVSIVIAALASMLTVSAGPGTADNPLITQSFLRGEFSDNLRESALDSINRLGDEALTQLNELYILHGGFSFAPKFTPVTLAPGETVRLTIGSSFTLLSGEAVITVLNGEVINITAGAVVESGAALRQFQRYFVTEESSAVITAQSTVTGHVDGFYTTDGDTPTPPRPPVTNALPFRDVRTVDWFFAAVEFVFNNGLFAGTSADTFSPNSPMTRGMFVTVLHRLDGLPQAGESSDFADVQDPARFYYDAVVWAAMHGIVTGVGGGRFAPDNSITREQMAAILYRYAEFKNLDLTADSPAFYEFADYTAVSQFAEQPMRWAVTQGVMQGADGRLNPRNTATRAQVAQIIYNFTG